MNFFFFDGAGPGLKNHQKLPGLSGGQHKRATKVIPPHLLSPCLFNLYAEYIIKMDETQAGIKIAGRNINNLRYADDTTLMAESKEELKSLLMKVKEESEKASLKLTFKKPRSWHPVPSIHGKVMEKQWKQ